MRTPLSVHDNFVYGYAVDCEGGRLVLHTAFRDGEPNELTDVVFRGVVAHHFEHVLSGNILFDVVESEAADLVRANAAVFADSWGYGWPPVEYRGDLDALVKSLSDSGVKAYAIESSYGLSGWVLAGTCEFVPRKSVAAIA